MRTLLLTMLAMAAVAAAETPKADRAAAIDQREAAAKAADANADQIRLLERDIAVGEKALASAPAGSRNVDTPHGTVLRADVERELAAMRAKRDELRGKKPGADQAAAKAKAKAEVAGAEGAPGK